MAQLKLFLDTNIVIDFLGKRQPYFEDARKLMLLGKLGEFDLWMSPSQFSDILYVLSEGGKNKKLAESLSSLRGLRTFVSVASIGASDIDKLLETDWSDAEDAFIYETALSANADAIITRNAKDFTKALIPVMNCDGLFKWMEDEFGLTYDEIDL